MITLAQPPNPFLSLGLLSEGLLTAESAALEHVFAVLVELQLRDDDVGRVNAKRDALAAGLVSDNALDVHNTGWES
ncbi:hypothetical protein ANO14919_066730 [Xylariales sp. No.14919]|nr:hypothetical protein ANO14919_066730 [Xylariales sp. No.14919]